ncbi:MAG: bifunctional glutamate N-acetyltransferase/amino-acid acetyltransferase ArgJ [Deltaproteobacteria bacterium]|jgi:glutamate N-acetyltransferase/amino-acid N-acetyltransferase|nr:bifunctional glutamate N-acetyltransferase/amino-acid acetyltransferase ArgJ [Deltaproteobacteria bacterium]
MMPPKGFRAGAVAAGLKYPDRLDLGLIVCDTFQASAGVFTQNICQAAPVLWSRPRVGKGRAVLVNSGQANAQTGADGLSDCLRSAELAAKLLGLDPQEVLLASTGVIGSRLNTAALLAGLPRLSDSLSDHGFDDFAKAIMTTDTVSKTAQFRLDFPSGPPAAIWGAAKGSGMIAPNMATMLGFVLTDCAVEPKLLSELLSRGTEATFNRVTVDGDTSTNDSLFLLSSGASGQTVIDGGKPAQIFEEALFSVLDDLARALARDGEGATKLVEIVVEGAKTSEQAKMAARTVAESPLVKTAFFGGDANWGRILAALGRSGAVFDPYQVNIDLGNIPWVRQGRDNGKDAQATEVMGRREYRLTISLGAGEASHSMLTCDFSHDYVTINGSYRS